MDRTINPSMVTARAATALLGIKRETLYAYVSRGLVRSVGGEGRERRYVRADLEALKARHDARAGHAAVAGGALRFGEPVLDSAITRIDPDAGPIYRGVPATEIASFEAAAHRLWESTPAFVCDGIGVPLRSFTALLRAPRPLDLLAALVPLLGARDETRYQLSSDAERAAVLIARMASALAIVRGRAPATGTSVASLVARALGNKSREAAQAIDQALVLCADHELNPSTFAARVAASAGADMYACIAAALATLSGPRHGGTCDRIEAMLHEIAGTNVARAVHERARRGEEIPGFGHRLYRGGDPRTAPMLDTAHAIAPRDPIVRTALALTRAMEDKPTMDLALVAIAAALRLPRGSAVGIFAIGRTAGWVAHVIEQRGSDYVLRPRARYVGP
jgi:citrate synthase